jgi:hypothetical protein
VPMLGCSRDLDIRGADGKDPALGIVSQAWAVAELHSPCSTIDANECHMPLASSEGIVAAVL